MTPALPRRAAARWLLPVLAPLLFGACGSSARLEPPPGRETDRIAILCLPNARFWFDSDPAAIGREVRLMEQRQAALQPPGRRGACRVGTGRPLTRSTAAITSRTEKPRP